MAGPARGVAGSTQRAQRRKGAGGLGEGVEGVLRAGPFPGLALHEELVQVGEEGPHGLQRLSGAKASMAAW